MVDIDYDIDSGINSDFNYSALFIFWEMNLKTPAGELFLVGPTYAKRLEKLGITTVGELLYHFPFRYLDYSLTTTINRIQPGETVSIKGKISAIKNEYTLRGRKIQRGVVVDPTGTVEAVWFNQPFLVRTLKPGLEVGLSGKVDFWSRKIALISPEYEILTKKGQIHTAGLVPVYHETYGVSSKWLRSRIAPLIKSFVSNIEEFLPTELLKEYGLSDLKCALEQIHFPKNEKNALIARKRFAFEELFILQLSAKIRQKSWQNKKVFKKLNINQEKILEFVRSLPFELTNAQKRSLKEILNDLGSARPMNRLLEGDVGSGKTVVAAGAVYAVFLNGIQSCLMAPTEILAHQHFQTISQLLSPLGVKISLLTGETKKPVADFDLIIGTHALIYQRPKFADLGLVIIDEQHRFGVEQRGQLVKRGRVPHVLTMTATPIPRTIALTLFGDLDLSVLDEMPKGRKIVKTWVVPPQKRLAAYDWIKKQINDNQSRAFVICPLIEQSDSETLQTVRAATTEYEKLKKDVFPDLKLGLLHGRLKSKDKNAVLKNFKQGKIDILVSTPVVEVGIDIPDATIMVIEAAERFGLAQLHQLRGRVGRSSRPSYCLLFSEYHDAKTLKRLKAMETTHLGMKLAEIDLEMRGPGEIFGTQQHGFINLQVASFNDLPLIEQTKKAADWAFPKLKAFPLLREKLKEDIIKTTEPN